MSELYRIAYVSQAQLPVENGAYATAIHQLLNFSQGWNADNETTGVLMFSTGRFAQVLEGRRDGVRALFGRIACDRRHRDLRLIEAGPIPERAFSNWAMAYTDGKESLDLSLTDFIQSPSSAKSASILSMLQYLVTPEEHAPSVFARPPRYDMADAP